jgi:hypothetical protein
MLKWDREKRELRDGSKIIKKFKHHATRVSFIVLDAFQEDGWPPKIFSPVRPRRGTPYDQVIRESVQSLNESFKGTEIKFYADSRKDSIGWKYVKEVQPVAQREA